jgi:hypothetical protein
MLDDDFDPGFDADGEEVIIEDDGDLSFLVDASDQSRDLTQLRSQAFSCSAYVCDCDVSFSETTLIDDRSAPRLSSACASGSLWLPC